MDIDFFFIAVFLKWLEIGEWEEANKRQGVSLSDKKAEFKLQNDPGYTVKLNQSFVHAT